VRAIIFQAISAFSEV